MPERVQQRRTKGWRKPDNTVSVSRPSKYGNPFAIGVRLPVYWETEHGTQSGNIEAETNEEAVAYFRDWLNGVVYLDVPRPPVYLLRGRNLMCFCTLDQACHADVLLELANQEP